MRIFDNPNGLKRYVIDMRLQKLDIDAESNPYISESMDGTKSYLVGVESDILSDKQIDSILSQPQGDTEKRIDFVREIDNLKTDLTKAQTDITVLQKKVVK